MPIYLEYLMDRFSAAGGSVQRRTLSSLAEVDARVVVNCVGLGARDLVDDASMEPIRGQIVRVRNPGMKRFVLDEDNPDGVTYIVPRSVTVSSAVRPRRASGISNLTRRRRPPYYAAAGVSSRA